MREILFKAKRGDHKWVEGDYFQDAVRQWHFIRRRENIENRFTTGDYRIIPETLCQYTGMTDDNGNKIWENDILLIDGLGFDSHTEIGKVYYDTKNFGYAVEFVEGEIDTYPLSEYNTGGVKVIGNVFDNTELLEVAK